MGLYIVVMKRLAKGSIPVIIKVIGLLWVCVCIGKVLILAGEGYHENFEDIVFFFFVALIGYVFFLFGGYIQEIDRIQKGIDSL